MDQDTSVNLSSEIVTIRQSEDIESVIDKNRLYLAKQSEIRKIISNHESSEDEIILEIVDAISKVKVDSPSIIIDILTIGINYFKRKQKEKKFKRVVEILLKKLFDVTLNWYTIDFQDLKETCDYIGGKGYFTSDDYRAIYIAIIQKLTQGMLRDKCIEMGLTDFINEKLVDIRSNYIEFKGRELWTII